jgi:hypothetical protein
MQRGARRVQRDLWIPSTRAHIGDQHSDLFRRYTIEQRCLEQVGQGWVSHGDRRRQLDQQAVATAECVCGSLWHWINLIFLASGSTFGEITPRAACTQSRVKTEPRRALSAKSSRCGSSPFSIPVACGSDVPLHNLADRVLQQADCDLGVQARGTSQRADSVELSFFAPGVHCRKLVSRLQLPDLVGEPEALRHDVHQCSIEVVDAASQFLQLLLRFLPHGGLLHLDVMASVTSFTSRIPCGVRHDRRRSAGLPLKPSDSRMGWLDAYRVLAPRLQRLLLRLSPKPSAADDQYKRGDLKRKRKPVRCKGWDAQQDR